MLKFYFSDLLIRIVVVGAHHTSFFTKIYEDDTNANSILIFLRRKQN